MELWMEVSFIISFVATKNTRGGKIARALIIILGELSDRSKCRVQLQVNLQVKLPRVSPIVHLRTGHSTRLGTVCGR